jgi:hypothetical protein
MTILLSALVPAFNNQVNVDKSQDACGANEVKTLAPLT